MDRFGGLSAAEDQVDLDVPPYPVGEDEGRVDAPAEYVDPSGGAGDVLEGEVGGRRREVSHHDEVAHGTEDV